MSKSIIEKNGEWNVVADDRGGCRYLFEDTCMNSFCPAHTNEVRMSKECRICRFYRPEDESESPDLIDRNELIALLSISRKNCVPKKTGYTRSKYRSLQTLSRTCHRHTD